VSEDLAGFAFLKWRLQVRDTLFISAVIIGIILIPAT